MAGGARVSGRSGAASGAGRARVHRRQPLSLGQRYSLPARRLQGTHPVVALCDGAAARCAMADQEGNVFLTLLKDKVLWLLLRPVMLLSTLVKKQNS